MFDLSRSPPFFTYSLFRCRFYRCLWFISFPSHLILSLQQPISGSIHTSHHHYTYHYQFILLHLSPYRHHIHVRHPHVHGSWNSLYMLHFIYEGMGFDHRIFEPSFLLFLSPYYLGLRYVPCLKTTLRPWLNICVWQLTSGQFSRLVGDYFLEHDGWGVEIMIYTGAYPSYQWWIFRGDVIYTGAYPAHRW